MRLKDKVIIVTGGAAGIGEEYCYGLAREAARIVVNDILPQTDVDAVVGVIEEDGGSAIGIRADITSEHETEEMVKKTVEKWGRIDGLINNACFQKAKPFDEYTVEEFDKMMAVNIKGIWLCIKAVYPVMKKQGKGKIVNIGSQTFFSGWWGLAPYVATKGAVVGLTRSLARDIGPEGIRVNCLCPGLTVTDGSLREVEASINPGHVNQWLDDHVDEQCIKHPGYPQDLVGPMIYLMSDDSDFMTGQTMLVDGGWAMH